MFQKMSMLRIYMAAGHTVDEPGLWRRMFRRSLQRFLVEQALREGIPLASSAMGLIGYLPGDKRVSSCAVEVAMLNLPVVVELIGVRAQLERFVTRHEARLRSAVLVIFDGLGMSAQQAARAVFEERAT